MKKRILGMLLVLVMIFSLAGNVLAANVENYTDVEKGAWYYEYVKDVVTEGYFIGFSETTFSPDTYMTRAQVVVTLARLAGETVDGEEANKVSTVFTDVPSGTWYSAAVKWAYDNNITTGVTPTAFWPNENVTREDACTFIARFLNFIAKRDNVTFDHLKSDKLVFDFADEAKIGSWAVEAVDACMAYGLVHGDTGDATGTFRPRDSWKRCEGAKMISILADILAGGKAASTGGYVPTPEESADVKTARELNALLAANSPENFYEVVQLLAEAGYDVENGIIPVAANHAFYWDPTTNTVVLVKGTSTVVYPAGVKANVEEWYDLAWTGHYLDLTEKEFVFEFGGTLTLEEDLYLTENQEGIHGKTVIDLNGHTLVIDANQFVMFDDVTIKNGFIKIVNRNSYINIHPDYDGSLNLEDVIFVVEAGLNVLIGSEVCIDGEPITVDNVQCLGNYAVTTASGNGYNYVRIEAADSQTTDKETVFAFGGELTLTEDLTLTENQEGIHGDALIDLNGHTLEIDANQFVMFADVTIKNGTIKIVGRNSYINIHPDYDGSLNLVNVKFEVDAGLNVLIGAKVCINGEPITVDNVECVGDYTVTTASGNGYDYIRIAN